MTDPVIIVGCGNIGSRLLQSVSNVKVDGLTEIIALEPFRAAWDIARERFDQENKGGYALTLVDNAGDLPARASLIIFAMDARNRLSAMQDVLPRCQTPHILLEKILFTKWDEYQAARALIDQAGAKCWVNTSRNIWSGYQIFKDDLAGQSITDFTVSGSDWGLGCNAIHFLSAFEFISGDPITALSVAPGTAAILESKRAGYQELTGTLVGKSENGAVISVASLPEPGIPISVNVKTANSDWAVQEGKQRDNLLDDQEPKPFDLLYTSQLHDMLEKIIVKGESDLPDFENSTRLHGLLIKALNGVFHGDKTLDKECPIT